MSATAGPAHDRTHQSATSTASPQTLLGQTSTTSEQADLARAILRQPADGPARSNHVWENHVFVDKDAYEMNP
jgi:hypothetical protein